MSRRSCVILASSSVRRRQLLERHGYEVVVQPPLIDDAGMPIRAQRARADCASLAWFKAAQVWVRRSVGEASHAPLAIVSADTVCVSGSRVMGKPTTEAEAHDMLSTIIGRPIEVFTGVCVVDLTQQRRVLFSESAALALCESNRARLAAHLASGAWQGRAGGFNIEEIAGAGWLFDIEGDRDVIAGLPMRALSRRLTEIEGTVARG